MKQVIPLAPEFISNKDGMSKQDCEQNAGKRLIDRIKKNHPRLPLVWACDGLYSKSPFIEKIKNECEQKGKPFPLHKYLHHGLSSQAMAFNLIGPLITRNDYEPLIQIIQENGIENGKHIDSAIFEYEDRSVFNEDSGQPTSIDIVLTDSKRTPVFFIESKLVEKEFGGCSVFSEGDCNGENPISNKEQCYLHFIGRKYWELMDKYGFSELL